MPRPPADASETRHATHPTVGDADRLHALERTDLLDTPPERAFDRLTELVRKLLGVPVALVSLVDAERQFFKSAQGLPEPWASLRETPLSHSFCQHVVSGAQPLAIKDARATPLVRDNLAVRDLGVVAYLGVPLVEASGHTIGALCAIDARPRTWTADEVEVLRELAALVISEIALRAHLGERQEAEAALRRQDAELRRLNESLEDSVRLRTNALVQALESMRKLNEELQNFAYVASHDLQEPLRKITLFASVVRQDYGGQIGDEGEQYLSRIQDSALRMQMLLRDLLAYARVTTHGQVFTRTRLDGLVKKVVSSFAYAIEASGARVMVRPLPTVTGDPQQLHQLFQNLLSNALRFARDGVPPEITIHARRESGSDRSTIIVEDNGRGFDERYRARVLQPFERLEPSDDGGTGMGLAICRRIVERHDGDFAIESTPGAGSRFSITLPRCQ